MRPEGDTLGRLARHRTTRAQRPGARAAAAWLLLLSLASTAFTASATPDQGPHPGGKGRGVEVRLTSPRLVEARPGAVVTAAWVVSARAGTARVRETVEVPEGVRLINPLPSSLPLATTLRAGDPQLRLVAFSVPAEFPAGRYTVRYAVTGSESPSLGDSDALTLVVLPVRRLELLVLDRPQAVIAGEMIRVRLRAANRGNLPVSIRLQAVGQPAFPASLVPEQLELAAGASRDVYLEAKTDLGARAAGRYHLTVRAESEAGEAVRAGEAVSVSVTVIPRVTGVADPYHRIDSAFTVGGFTEWAGGERGNGYWVELAGGGRLDEKGGREVEFLFRGPGTQDVGRYGEMDEYRLSVRGQRYALRLGDQAYALTPLTEAGRYARGAEAEFQSGAWSTGALYTQNRPGQAEDREAGAYLRFGPRPWFSLQAGILGKWGEEVTEGSFSHRLYSLRTTARAGRLLEADLEYSFSDSERDGGGKSLDRAYRVDLAGRLPGRIDYVVEKTRAEPDFFGYYHDVDVLTAALLFPIRGALRGSLSLREYANNLDRDPARGSTATEERALQAGVSYDFTARTRLSLDYERLARADRLGTPDVDFDQDLLRLTLGQSTRWMSAQGYVARGIFHDRLTGERESGLEQYGLNATLRPSSTQQYSVFVRAGHASFLTDTPTYRKSAGLDAAWQPGRRVRLNLGYRRDNIDAEAPETDYLNGALGFLLPNGHRVTARGEWRRTGAGGETRAAAMAEYSIPFGIPVARNQGVGSLRGRVYEGAGPGGPGVPGVVLSVGGATAVTDRRGEFVFPALRPGPQHLQADSRTVGPDRITTVRTPLEVDVPPGGERRLDFGVVPACRVTGVLALPGGGGTVRRDEEGSVAVVGSGSGLPPEGPGAARLQNVVVEIVQGHEIYRELTDRKGAFAFPSLRPGTWTLSVHAADLPAQHHLERERFILELEPGEERHVAVGVVPRMRTIQMIDAGRIE